MKTSRGPVRLRSLPASSLEPLEARIAPAALATLHLSADGHTAGYTDVDGDHVTIAVTGFPPGGGVFTPGLFSGVASGSGEQLQLLNLSAGGFDHASLTFSVVRTPGGDGVVNVGYINSTGHDLGIVTVKGDLGQIDAGDGTLATPGMKALAVRSLGRLSIDTQAGGGNLESDITGRLGALVVTADVKEAFVNVTGGADGKIGAITIGGSLIGGSSSTSGEIFSSGDMGAVKIGHDVEGGSGGNSGLIKSLGKLAVVRIGGSLLGGSNTESGEIFSSGDMGPVRIGHDMQGGSGVASGFISTGAKLAGLNLGGSLIGGSSTSSGAILSTGDMGAVRIGHDLQGGSGANSGMIHSFGKLAGVSIGGSIVGGSNADSGEVQSSGDMGAVTIGHDVEGGSTVLSGLVHSGGNLGQLTIGGSLIGGAGSFSGFITIVGNLAGASLGGSILGGSNSDSGEIFSSGDMGRVRIGHDVRGGSAFHSGEIHSQGKLASASIGGSVIGGSSSTSGEIFSSGDMGAVKIGHDVQGGSGIDSGEIQSLGKLASVSIGGSLVGGSATYTGEIFSVGVLGAVKIGHDLVGASIAGTVSLDSSGVIESISRILSVTVGGSIISGVDNSSGTLSKNATIRAGDDLGSLVVGESLIGHGDAGTGSSPVVITGRGQHTPLPLGATTDLAIAKISIGGGVEFANILAGYDFNLNAVNGDAQIGAVHVRGDWIASNLVAGVKNPGSANRNFGGLGDVSIGAGSSSITAKIASITIDGQVLGTPNSFSIIDHFGFSAERIYFFKAGGDISPLTSGTAAVELSQTTGDVTIRQV